MIRNDRVLEPQFVPRDVVHRHTEIDTLSGALEPLLAGNRADPPTLSGPPGVGKTCIARYTLRELTEASHDVTTAYVNCLEHPSRYRTLYAVLEAISPDAVLDVHRQSTPHDELLARVRDRVTAPTVVVLDEVDQVEDTDLLYALHTMPEVTLVLITTREVEFYARLEDRLHSRLQAGASIRFDPYSDAELVAILRDRVEQGLAPGVVSDARLAEIAGVAAGDARVALGVLREAARRAAREGANAVTSGHVSAAEPAARASLRDSVLDRLTDHQRELYEVVRRAGEIAPGELYDRYRERVDEPKSERTLRSYLEKLEDYDLIRREGENRGRRYSVVS